MEHFRQATWLELFFDLVFVAVIGVLSHELAHLHDGHLDYQKLMTLPLIFIPVWWIWGSFTLFANRFDQDNRTQRFISLLVMGVVIILSNSIDQISSTGYQLFTISYFITRIILSINYFLFFFSNKKNQFAKVMGIEILLTGIIILSSIFFPATIRYYIFGVGVLLDMIFHIRNSNQCAHSKIHRKHLAERIGLITIILLGESVISIVAGISDMNWDYLRVLSAVAGFISLGLIWWIFFDSFHVFDTAKKFVNENFLLYPNLFFCLGLISLATLIRHGISGKMSLDDFHLLSVVGMTLFYIGKQTPYMYLFPSMKKGIIINTFVCIFITFLSGFLSKVEYALVGIMVAMLFYVIFNYLFVIPKDWSKFLENQ